MEVTGNVTTADGTTQEMSPQEAQEFLTAMSDERIFAGRSDHDRAHQSL